MHLYNDALIDFFVNRASLQRQCILNPRQRENVEAYTSIILLHMPHLGTKPYSLSNRETTLTDTCYSPFLSSPFETLFPYHLVHNHFNVRWENGALGMQLVDHTHIHLNGSLSITFVGLKVSLYPFILRVRT